MSAEYSPLSTTAIQQLCRQGCSAVNWATVEASPFFNADNCHNVHFSGTVRLGQFTLAHEDTISRSKIPSGIYNAYLHNVDVGDNVLIRNIGNISNINIETEARIENCQRITASGTANFAHGELVNVLQESGGRLVPLGLYSNQVAYLAAGLKYQPEFSIKLQQMIQASQQTASPRGIIGKQARLIDCQVIEDVRIDRNAVLTNVSLLQNGTIYSSESQPMRVGTDVIARNFIFAAGSIVNDQAQLDHCFVGTGTQITKGFCAEHCLFFCNCELSKGEACAVLAGSYTVSHHKSSLLIASDFSFFNAGSGTNFSNHNYKLGAIHQGRLERGCKTGISSSLIWPSHIAPFTLIIGAHRERINSQQFPFSYLIATAEGSLLLPGANFYRAGLVRDQEKWQVRDQRGNDCLDRLNYEIFTPYTIMRVLQAITSLKELTAKNSDSKIRLQGYYLKTDHIPAAIDTYQQIVSLYLQRQLVLFLDDVLKAQITKGSLFNLIRQTANKTLDNWIDLAGLIILESDLSALITAVQTDQITKLSQLEQELDHLRDKFDTATTSWILRLFITQVKEKHSLDNSADGNSDLVTDLSIPDDILYLEITTLLNEQLTTNYYAKVLDDAGKDYSSSAHFSYAYPADHSSVDRDFIATHGEFSQQPLVQLLYQQEKTEQERRFSILTRLEQL